LRLGYYKLTRPKTKGNDWVWIVDHTIQLGCEKGFVIEEYALVIYLLPVNV